MLFSETNPRGAEYCLHHDSQCVVVLLETETVTASEQTDPPAHLRDVSSSLAA